MNETDQMVPDLAECLERASETKYMVVKEKVIEEIPDLLNKYFPGCPVFLGADKNTYKAAGAAVLERVRAAGIEIGGSYIFDGQIHAEYRHVETLKKELSRARKKYGKTGLVPLAAGAGTINDLVKKAAAELELPYFCVPTAASVDGYTAYGAALLYQGFKQTMPCSAPAVVAADSSVLAAAPAYLSSSGFGDLAGKIIAGTDWIIADKAFALDGKGVLAPGSQAIESTAWSMVQGSLRRRLKNSVNAAGGDKNALKILFEGLGITGFALQYMKNSRPVSGCEHMWSHVWEMENLSIGGLPVTHGHKVAMGTLAAAAFTECLFRKKPSPSRRRLSWAEREEQVRRAFAGLDQAAAAALTTCKEKFVEGEQARQLETGLLDIWEDIREAVFEKLPPTGKYIPSLKKRNAR
jgi:glycerol-1-phosphate dehydrogenase [NAD(P)+]